MEYNALIREYDGHSLGVVARVLLSDFNDLPTSWKIRYKGEEVDRTCTNISDLCSGPLNPIQIYKPGAKLFTITVRTMQGESFEVTVSPTDTKRVLKLKIFQARPSFPPRSQHLYFCSPFGHINSFEAFLFCYPKNATLDTHGLVNGSTVWLKLDHLLLYEHQWFMEPMPIDLKMIFSEGPYMKLSVGVNICGKCTNPFCPSKSNGSSMNVVAGKVPYGRAFVDFANRSTALLTCSVCDSDQSEQNVQSGMYQGRWPITPEFLYVVHARADLIFRETAATFNTFRALLKRNGKFKVSTAFRDAKMELTVVEPWRSPYSCVKCDTKIMFARQEKRLSCGHYCHSWCTSLFKNNCSVCRSTVVLVGKMGDLVTSV